MHPRNKYYNNTPDFIKIAASYPSLKKYIKYNKYSKQSTIDFKDPRACRELTYALLWYDFQIRLEIPLDSLCPVIPGRLDYIHWIEDLINDTSKINDNNNIQNNTYFESNIGNINNSEKKVLNPQFKGIDIGTGASCIYPLLACKLHSNWKFEALELNERSYEYAKDNVERNKFENQIKVRKVKNEKENIFSLLAKKKNFNYNEVEMLHRKPNKNNKNNNINDIEILKLLLSPDYTFCMCNPPFYSSENEMEQSKELKIEEPHSICTGSKNEMLTEGGEIQFISTLIDDSIQQYKRKRKAIKKLYKLIKYTKDSNILKEQLLKKQLFKKGLTIQWYTSLIGKKSSVEPLVNYLKTKKQVKTIKTTNFKQGKTVRWGIAWTFKDLKLSSFLEKEKKKKRKK
ncbi:S-adenosyl-L-methionine dependent methyltransferase [Anaeromyces robustus]|uniref:U6 small nuclear RNA (adenine-(43)-N(6))-methyltransferase n=1 Tax=Anaeromyces robustus TaxID=1754192 RepID=A0A1Y1X834_9FUNG|nr:S-adenosyl-L-methionine dependent methyltransferase [Anaeromyces robustus]|eukprot:ORX81919.1 S-adenosyl-L-methionine dependent methyltransferase [Anaeromyces robustus]